jgi:hypothetical protein
MSLVVINSINSLYDINTGITPLQAYSIDSKTDDGLPDKGRTIGGWVPTVFDDIYVYSTAGLNCVVVGAGGALVYNMSGSAGSALTCAMNFAH